ncbi:Hypothetical predicted protein, partial [Pelobates cultripes]
MAAMLQTLRSSLREDYKEIAEDIRKEIQSLGTRTEAMENKTDDLCTANNEMADKIARMEVEQTDLKIKMADMEDRSRRKKLR